MDSIIITALISAATSLISVLISKLAGSLSKKKDHASEALINLYSPLALTLEKSHCSDARYTLYKLRTTIENNFALVPPVIQSEIKQLSTLENICTDRFEQLQEIVLSFFNWYRKYLGYPYDKSRINAKYTPRHDRNVAFWDFVSKFCLFVSISAILLTFIFCLIESTNATHLDQATLYASIISLSIVCFSLVENYRSRH